MSVQDIQSLVGAAQFRNRPMDVSGVLVADSGAFLQVLEGPPDALEQLARRIRRDRRHHSIEVLCDRGVRSRVFSEPEMRLAVREMSLPGGEAGVLHPDERLMAALYARPERLPALLGALSQVDETVRWCPERDAGLRAEALLRLLIDGNGAGETARVDAWLAQAAPGLRGFVALIEDAATSLGRLWQCDGCGGGTVSVALAALQGAIRRRAQFGALPAACRGRVLIATPPRETHVIGAVLKAEILRAAGWDVDKVYAVAGDDIGARVAETGYDAVVVVGSRVFSRSDRRALTAKVVSDVRSRSRTPDTFVIAGGADFALHPEAGREVGADGVCPSAAVIDRMIERRASLTRVA